MTHGARNRCSPRHGHATGWNRTPLSTPECNKYRLTCTNTSPPSWGRRETPKSQVTGPAASATGTRNPRIRNAPGEITVAWPTDVALKLRNVDRPGISWGDAIAALVAALSFVVGLVAGFWLTATVGTWLLGPDNQDLGAAVAGATASVAVSCAAAWGGSRLSLGWLSRFTHQERVLETWSLFGIFVWGAFAITIGVTSIDNGAFVLLPVLFAALVAAYLVARWTVVRRDYHRDSPGWYADPTRGDRWRWWDGYSWTDHESAPWLSSQQ